MPLRILFCIAFCFTCLLPFAIGQTNFSRQIGLNHFESMISPQLPGGDFLIVVDNRVMSNTELILLRIDALGQTRASWRMTTQPTLANMRPYCITQLADGRVATAGDGTAANQYRSGFVAIVDSSGQATTASMASFGTDVKWKAIAATPDSGLVVCGIAQDTNYVPFSIVARYDKQLGLVWKRMLTLPNQNVQLSGIVVLPGGNLLLGGHTRTASGDYLPLLAHADAGGNLTWANTYTSAAHPSLPVSALGHDGQGGLLMSGLAPSSAVDQVFAMAIDTAGAFLSANSLVDPNNRSIYLGNMSAGHGGTFILHTRRQGTTVYEHGVAAAFSSTAGLLWARTLQVGWDSQSPKDVVPHADGGYLWVHQEVGQLRLMKTDGQGLMSLPCGPFPLALTASPMSMSATAVSLDTLTGLVIAPLSVTNTSTVVTNVSDCITLEAEAPVAGLTAQVLPQPLRSSARIQFSKRIGADAQLHITDLSGRSIALPVTRLADGFEVERGGLPAGIYAYQVLQGGRRIASGKLWVAD